MNKPLKIIADENMPLVDELFSSHAEIIKLPGRKILPKDVINADALLVRSITRVDSSLLDNTSVQFVGSATIGTDHIDKGWLVANHIQWANAAGCNAAAVAQYVISGICYWALQKNKTLQNIRVGILGAGNVGTELARCLDILNIAYELCDPPLQIQGDQRKFVSLKDILKCDVVTIHVPLTHDVKYATHHMFDAKQLSQLNTNQLVINAARGSVINNGALSQYLSQKRHADFILDVFENEPDISNDLVDQCLLATPHIAGHTLEGKFNGTFMVYEAFCKHFNIQSKIKEAQLLPIKNQFSLLKKLVDIRELLLSFYNIHHDYLSLVSGMDKPIGEYFDTLRKNYPSTFGKVPRRDYSGWNIQDIIDNKGVTSNSTLENKQRLETYQKLVRLCCEYTRSDET